MKPLAIAALLLAGCAAQVDSPAGNPVAAGEIRRITDAEYAVRVHDVLHVTVGDITTRAASEPFTDALAAEYQAAAQSVAKQAVEPTSLTALLGTDAIATDAQLTSFFDGEVSALWQRSVTPSEAAVLRNIYRSTSQLGADGPSRAFDLMLQAVLQAPSFLFRAQAG